MTTAHHITFPAPPPAPTNLYDEDEVEGETILLGKEIQIKRSYEKAVLRNAEERHHIKNQILRSQYKTYLEELEKYEKKEEIKEDIKETELNPLKESSHRTFTYYTRKEYYERLKTARDKNFKKKWTAILEPYYNAN